MLGLYLNIGALEAKEDLRWLYNAGAMFGGEKSKPYVDSLIEMAWEEDDEMAQVTKQAFEAADSGRGVEHPRSNGRDDSIRD